MIFNSGSLQLLLHYADEHIAQLSQLSATKTRYFLALQEAGYMSNGPQDHIYAQDGVAYIRITEKGKNLLKLLYEVANDYQE